MRLLFILAVLCTNLTVFGQNQKVLILGIDGCRSDALEIANTPNMDALMANGTFSYDALNTGVTSSGPGWSSMLTGVWQDKHGVTDNSFSGSNYDAYPHFLQRVEEHNPNLSTISIANWDPINDNIVNGDADVAVNVSSDSEVATQAIDFLTNADPDVLFLDFDDCDYEGHSTGFSPNNPAYINVIEITDNYICLLYTSPSPRDS